MAQGKETGAEANRWGRETARKIAEKIGARMLSGNSNQCEYQRQRAVIKCAKPDTDRVGVTCKMLPRLDLVIGAFQSNDGSFRLSGISSDAYAREMEATRSKGPFRGKGGMVSRSFFREKGTPVGTVHLD